MGVDATKDEDIGAGDQGIMFGYATDIRSLTKGRASYLGERSIGHQDPGATSIALIFKALANA